MLLPQLELDFQTPLLGESDDLGGGQRHIGKPLATFDSGYTYIGAKVQVRGPLALCDSDLEGAASGYGGNIPVCSCGNLTSRYIFVCYQPTGHGDFKN
jgi:hypothetical protein